MEQPASKEPSPAPSERGLKGVLAKARRSRMDNSSTPSVNGTDNSSEGRGIRTSVDSLQDKTLPSRLPSSDDGKPTASDKLSKLVPARIKKKRRERKEAEQQQEEVRGRSIGSQGGPSGDYESQSGQQSPGDDGGSSLITMDSDIESPLTTPPPLTSHQSHIGYLTSTSPLIKSTTVSAPSNSSIDAPTFQAPEYHKSTTLPVSSNTSSSTNLAPRHAASLDTRQSEKESSRNGRGISPGAKIKEVFTPGSRKKRVSPPTSPDRASVKSSESGTTLGGFFGTGERRKSATLDQAFNALEDRPVMPQSMDTDSKIRTVKKPDIPHISTTPQTPPSASPETPLTTVTPPTPTDQLTDPPGSPSVKPQQPASTGTNPKTATSTSSNVISHRRARSDSATHPPSKLSNAMSAPLTPTIEEISTPGTRSPGVSTSPGGPAGFFSSVFSAAQNAANTLSNTIANNPPRARSSSQMIDEGSNQEIETGSTTVGGVGDVPSDPMQKLAIDTLGSGDLSLQHLGIATDPPSTNNSTTGTFPTALNGSPRSKDSATIRRDEAAARAEDASAARAVSAAYSDTTVNEPTSTPIAEDAAPAFKTRSTYENSVAGDKTPPNGSIFEGEGGFKRSGSVRSRVGAVARRHRNSSGATGSTIAAAIGAGHSALANPSASGSTPKLTGFAVASKKRNRDFHQLFRSVPEDDYLIEDYSCALQRDIILAGRIYVSEGHICFSSNILGWVTTLIISFDEVVSIEKENTAMVFPNAIAIQTLHARHTFRSLLSREATYELLVGIWKLSHPQLKSSLNGVTLDTGGTGDKTEKAEPSSEDASDLSEDEEDVYDEDKEEEEGLGSFTEAGDGSVGGSDFGEPVSKPAIRKASSMGNAIGSAAGSVPTNGEAKAGEKAAAVANAASVDFPGPLTHAPTECSDGDTHYDRILKDEIIPAPLGKVYSMIFGPASGGFMTKWLLDDIKVTELQMEDDKKGLDAEGKSRSYSYIKPLYASIGPKSTKCLIVENMDSFDLEKAVSVTVSTQTPDVPSGNIFTTKTKFCLMWAPGNATRLLMNFTIEWSGKSWLKGPIEKGASDGQGTYANDLVKALKQGLASRSRTNTLGAKVKSKGKRRKGDADMSKSSLVDNSSKTSVAQKQDHNWGVFEPLHSLFGPVVDPVMALINSQIIIGFLLLTLLITWYRSPTVPSSSHLGFPGMTTPERIAAYEEIWRAEESDLWNWLEERVGMEGMAYPANARREDPQELRKKRERDIKAKGRGLRAKLADEKMADREIDEAIRTTEERLRVLKGAVRRKRDARVEQGAEEEDRGQGQQGKAADGEDEGYSSGARDEVGGER